MSKRVIFTCSLILILGLLAGWDMINHLIAGRLYLNIGIFFIPIGIGLFLGSAAVRTAASLVFYLIYAVSAVVLVASLFGKMTAIFELPGNALPIGNAVPFVFVIVLIFCSVTALIHWTLYSQPFDEHLK